MLSTVGCMFEDIWCRCGEHWTWTWKIKLFCSIIESKIAANKSEERLVHVNEHVTTPSTHTLHMQLWMHVSTYTYTHTLRSPNVHENTHTHTHRDGHVAHWLPALIECLSWQMDCWNHTCNAPLASPLPFIHQGLCVSAGVCALVCVFMCEEEDRVS